MKRSGRQPAEQVVVDIEHVQGVGQRVCRQLLQQVAVQVECVELSEAGEGARLQGAQFVLAEEGLRERVPHRSPVGRPQLAEKVPVTPDPRAA